MEQVLSDIIDEPEYVNPEAFIQWARDNNLTSFDTIILQAISRNVAGAPAPGQEIVRSVKQKLTDAGLTYEPRGAVPRGVRTDKHSRGTLRYDGWAAGSGLFKGLPGIGSGQGAMGGSKQYDPTAPGALPMGSKRR
jgi:hypothetical protein